MTTPVTIRRADERGVTRLDWLDSRHTFSFASYRDPEWMGFRALRVINDDRIRPGGGFGTHPHRDMEILTWVLEGAVQHRDSMGNTQVIRAGELQRMTAGTGVTHSEHNPSDTDPLHLLQVWILPEHEGLAPSYEQARFGRDERRGRWQLLAAREPRDGALTVHQDVAVKAALLDAGDRARHDVPPGRHAFVHVATGTASIDDHVLEQGAALATSGPATVTARAEGDGHAEVLLFDLA